MRTIEVNLYSYDELSETEQVRAIETLRSLAVPKDWHEVIVAQADAVGVTFWKNLISCDGTFQAEIKYGVFDVIEAIKEQHQEGSIRVIANTWAELFESQWEAWREEEEAADGCVEVVEYEDSDLYKASRRAFEIALQDEFNRRLTMESLRINSRQYIESYIRENNYEFDHNGELYGN